MAWYLDNEGWWRPIREGRYNGERLGLERLMDVLVLGGAGQVGTELQAAGLAGRRARSTRRAAPSSTSPTPTPSRRRSPRATTGR